MHPDDAEGLLAEIRAVSDAPIRWVINSQSHGDHYMGNSVFAREGATIIAHRDTPRVMIERFDYEVSSRPFDQRGQNRNAVQLVLPDILFDHRLTLTLGQYEVELLYLGAGQNEGDTLIHFPHARALHSGGVFHNRSWANTSLYALGRRLALGSASHEGNRRRTVSAATRATREPAGSGQLY